jgi:hypothetical protein
MAIAPLSPAHNVVMSCYILVTDKAVTVHTVLSTIYTTKYVHYMF